MNLAKKISLTTIGIVVLLLVGCWVNMSKQVAHVVFSKDQYCSLQFHQWYSGKCILSYFKNGVCVGVVRLNNDWFNDPLAMFPEPDGLSAVCLSWPDTFNAAFTVDFLKAEP